MSGGHLFGGGQLPADLAQRQAEEEQARQQDEQRELDRLQRCRWSQEISDYLLGGPMPSLEAKLYFGSALSARLRGDVPDLEQALRLRPVQGSKRTAAVLLGWKPSSR